MHIKQVMDDIYRLSVNIEDKKYLFEGIWPIPHGISINGYLIKSEKNVMIDLTQDIFNFPQEFTQQMGGVTLGRRTSYNVCYTKLLRSDRHSGP